MKTLLSVALLCISSSCSQVGSPNADRWLTKSAEIEDGLVNDSTKLPETQFYECRMTRLGTAISRLKDVSYIELSDELATYYAGHSYRPHKGTKAYLVRGAFTHYTGGFDLYFYQGKLLVRHDSLGPDVPSGYCPLIVQLPEAPEIVLIQVGGAL